MTSNTKDTKTDTKGEDSKSSTDRWRSSGIASTNIPCDADIHRRLASSAAVFLAELFHQGDEEGCALAILGMVTGIDFNDRVLRLADPGTLPSDRSEILAWKESGILAYAVKNGATDFAATDRSRPSLHAVMQLSIPSGLVPCIEGIAAAGRAKSVINRVNEKAVRHARTHPGLSPTCARLRASFVTLVETNGLTPVESGMVSGTKPPRVGAHMDYCRFDLGETNQYYRDAVTAFVKRMLETDGLSISFKDYLKGLTIYGTLPCGWVGSQVAVPVEEIERHVGALMQHVSELQEKWNLAWGQRGMGVLAQLLNSQNAILYLKVQVAACTRPPGKMTRIVLASPEIGCCVRDKGSREGIEISLSPALPQLLEQWGAVKRSLSQAIELCMRLGIAVESLDSMDIDREIVALHFRYDPMRNRMVIRRMTRAGFMITMRGANADIAALYRHRANIVRHSIVTWFQRKHLGQVVPEFAGHRNAGLEFCGAWSMARKEEMTALAKNLGKVVDALFPKTVEVWVKSTADSVDPSITRMLGNWANGAFDKKAICDRKQVLPQRVEDFAMLAAIEKVSEHIWSRYLAEDRTVEELTMAFVILLCTEAGAGRPIAMELVWNVRRRDLQPDGEIAISIHPSDTSERRSRIQLPLKPRLLFYVIAWRQSGCGEHEPLLPPLNKAAEGKQAGSRSRFVELYEEFKAGYLRSVGENAPPLGKILDLGQQLLYHRGIEPAVLTVLNTLPLPVSQPLDRWRTMVRRLRSGIQPPPELVRAKPVETREPGHQRVEIRPQVEEVKDPDSSDEMTPSWCDGAERRMRAVIAKLAEITDKRLVWKTYGEDISRVINEALDAASNEGPNTSVEHLVLRWVRWTLYDGDGITASTVGTYLERMFFRGFLDSEDSRDLSSWDQDDLEGIVEERVEGDGIGASTASDILMVFGMFYRYLSEHEGFKSVDLSDLDVDWSGGAGRSDVLGPVEFDVFLRYRAAPADRESHMRAAASALGYGAGMRPIELSKLSLLDIEEYGDEIRINVLGGKTDAARRAISFSQTASPVAVRCIKEYLALRRSEFGQHGLRGVALFGDQYDRLGYKRRDLSGKVKHDLHAWFGDTIDTYHLRHSFATWLVVRAFMVREPGLRHRLLDASAEIFSDECMARFAVFLSGGKAEKAHRSHESDLRVIAKTMGHLDPETTFRHYVHLFDVIHAHAVLRVDDPQAVLSRQAMTSLLRGIRDSEMSGIREARKIAEICSFLERRLFRGM